MEGGEHCPVRAVGVARRGPAQVGVLLGRVGVVQHHDPEGEEQHHAKAVAVLSLFLVAVVQYREKAAQGQPLEPGRTAQLHGSAEEAHLLSTAVAAQPSDLEAGVRLLGRVAVAPPHLRETAAAGPILATVAEGRTRAMVEAALPALSMARAEAPHPFSEAQEVRPFLQGQVARGPHRETAAVGQALTEQADRHRLVLGKRSCALLRVGAGPRRPVLGKRGCALQEVGLRCATGQEGPPQTLVEWALPWARQGESSLAACPCSDLHHLRLRTFLE